MRVVTWAVILLASVISSELLFRLFKRPVIAILGSGVVAAVVLHIISYVELGHQHKFIAITFPLAVAYGLLPAALYILGRQMLDWWRQRNNDVHL